MDLPTSDIIRALASTLGTLPHGGKRDEVQRVADRLGWSVARVYESLAKVGWTSGRKRRSDAGKTSVTKEVLLDLATTINASVRANGKVLMDVPNARSMLASNGRDVPVSNGHLSRLLRKRQMHAAALKRPTAHTQMQSLHPNHVHQVDPSYCVLYYLPGKKGVTVQQWANEDQFYKNKPENFEKTTHLRVWRYVLTDHFSDTVLVRYYQSAGENQTNLYDFLLWCWARQPNRPMHGVPKILLWDKGSANTSAAIRQALAALEVDDVTHAAGQARVKGQVEGGNNLVEKLFESRLRFEPVHSVDQLNAAAERWMLAYNANAIPHYDSRLNREGMAQPLARFALWQMIRREQLRILPDINLCRSLLTRKAETRKVTGSLTITFRHPQADKSLTYDLRDLPGVFVGGQVHVAPLVYGDRQVKVTVTDYQGESRSFSVSPVVYNELTGFRVDAPVWGQEYQAQPDSLVDATRKAADANAYPEAANQADIEKLKKRNAAPFGGLDAHSHLGKVYTPAYMPRPGTDIDLPDANLIETKPLSIIEACKRIRATIGRALSQDENALIRDRYPTGVPVNEYDQLVELLANPNPQTEVKLSLVK